MMKGYDVYETSYSMEELFDIIQDQKLEVFQIRQKESLCFSSVYKYRKVLTKFDQISLKNTIGIFGIINRFFLSKEKIISFLSCAIFLFFLSKTIFVFEIRGESQSHFQMVEEHLSLYKTPFLMLDKNEMTNKLTELNGQLNWYGIYQKGSRLILQFQPRKSFDVQTFDAYDLIASKSGVIAAFDVLKGTKTVKLNEYVNQGDVLVSHILLDSKNEEKTTEVFGKVFAYTFQKVNVEIKKNDLPEFLQYYECLLRSRMQIQLDEDEKIIQEIPLQFERNLDTITMTNFYVLYEMISEVGESIE